MGSLSSRWRTLHLFILLIIICNAFAAQKIKSAEQRIIEAIFSDKSYDQRVRPISSENASAPVLVLVNFYLRSVDTLDDKNHQYTVQLSYRQKWRDERLSFSPMATYAATYTGNTYSFVPLSGNLQQINLINPHNQIWRPDTFFSNEKDGKYHDLMSRNEFARVSNRGDVLHSSRITLRLVCPMNFRKFPLDSQTCYIRLASYGYTTNDLKYEWEKNDPVQVSPNLVIPNFFLSNMVTSTCDSITTTGTYSCLRAELTFKRVFKPYFLNIYIPCTMMVIVSWLSFWVSPIQATGRLLLTVLNLFVLAIQTSDVNKLFPLTSYTKSVDTWTGVCLTFVMGALVEFVVVHYISRRDRGQQQSSDGDCNNSSIKGSQQHGLDEEANPDAIAVANRSDEDHEIPLKDLSLNDGGKEEGEDEKKTKTSKSAELKQRVEDYSKRYLSKFDSLPEKIDGASRVLFPAAFLLFNVFYWISISI